MGKPSEVGPLSAQYATTLGSNIRDDLHTWRLLNIYTQTADNGGPPTKMLGVDLIIHYTKKTNFYKKLHRASYLCAFFNTVINRRVP
jgi:hypothetical protein